MIIICMYLCAFIFPVAKSATENRFDDFPFSQSGRWRRQKGNVTGIGVPNWDLLWEKSQVASRGFSSGGLRFVF